MTAKKLLITLELCATPDDVSAIIKVKTLHISKEGVSYLHYVLGGYNSAIHKRSNSKSLDIITTICMLAKLCLMR